MVIALHNLARSYKLLPSQALERATTFDLYVLDVYNRRQIYDQEQAEAKQSGRAPPPPKKLSQEELLAMFNRVKEKEQTDANKKRV